MIPLTILLGLVIPFGAIIFAIILLCAVIFIIKKVPDVYVNQFWKNVLIWVAGLIFLLWICNVFGVFHMAISV